MTQVKLFTMGFGGVEDLEERVNTWINENHGKSVTEIFDIKHNLAKSDGRESLSVMIVYDKKKII